MIECNQTREKHNYYLISKFISELSLVISESSTFFKFKLFELKIFNLNI